jgi:hypothetical protein
MRVSWEYCKTRDFPPPSYDGLGFDKSKTGTPDRANETSQEESRHILRCFSIGNLYPDLEINACKGKT